MRAPSAPRVGVSFSRRSSIVVALVVVAMVAGVLAARLWMRPGDPGTAQLQGTDLVALDGRRREVWRVEMPGVDAATTRITERETAPAIVRDVDGDGHSEVLFNYHPLAMEEETGRLICFTHRGAVQWEFSYAANLTVDGRYFEPFYVGHLVRWVVVDGEPFVLVVARHAVWYPTRVILLDPASGTVRGEYWHPGYIMSVAFFDVHGDGREELVVGGINNPGPGPGHPSLAVLRVPFGEPAGDLPNVFGEHNALERAYLLFPRPAFLEQHALMGVQQLDVQGANRLLATVSGPEATVLFYYLDRDLHVVDMRPSDSLLGARDRFYHDADRTPPDPPLAAWRRVERFPTAPNGNGPEVRRAFAAGAGVQTGRNR